MAQHDYVIDNSTGANVRADINSVLQAIASNNSGSSAPSTTYAFQLFANTTTSKLQIRNSANSAFVDLIGLDGSILLADGSVSSPSLAFSDDLNTGIFSSAADTLNFTTGGVERMELGTTTIFNEDGADVDFRIEGDTDANLLFVNAGTDRVGIGTASPDRKLEVINDNSFAAKFGGAGGGSDFAIEIGQVGTSGSPGFNAVAGSMIFQLAGSEKARFDTSTGNFGINNNSPDRKLEVQNDGDYAAKFSGGSGTGASSIEIGQQSTNGSAGFNATGGSMLFDIDGTEKMRITALGKLGINTATPDGSHRTTIIEDTNGHGVLVLDRTSNIDSTFRSFVSFERSGSVVGTIRCNNSGTQFNTSSDYRLKENVVTMSNATDRLKQLQPKRFNFILNPDITVDGFLAHEVQSVVPEAISGTKDETQDILYTEEDTIPSGKKVGDVKETVPIYQGIDQSKLVPLLVAAVKELIGKVEALEAA